MDQLTRRSFLKNCTIAAGAALVRDLQTAAQGPGPHISFPATPRDRIAVASYPFRAYIESPTNHDRNPAVPGMDLTQFAAEVLRKFGVHNIEPHSRHFRSLDAGYLGKFREELAASGSKVVNIAVSVEQSFYDPDLSARKKSISDAKKWVDVAAAIGSPSVRTHIRPAANSAPNLQRTADTLREVTEYAASQNIVVNLENDDLASEDAFFLVKVIEGVNHPYLRALPDFANSILTGDADFNDRALQALFQHAYCICHVKDGEADDHGKQYRVDLKRVFEILNSSGYKGYCSIEFDEPGDPYAATAKLIQQTVRYLS